MAQVTDNRWPEVTNPRAREILGYVAALPGCNRSKRFVERLDGDLYKSLSASITLDGLHETDLADKLLHSPHELLDQIRTSSRFDALNIQGIKLYSTKQLVEDLAYNLAWYCTKGNVQRRFCFQGIYWARRLFSIFLVALILLAGLVVQYKVIYFAAALYVIFVGGLLLRNFRNYRCRPSGLMDPGFTASLLYHYLLQEYSEPVQDSST